VEDVVNDGAPVKDRRQRLVDAARALFFARGYPDVRMVDVARGAGFSKRTVYLEFESKAELFATICEEGVEILLQMIEAPLDQELPVLEDIRAQGRAYLRFWKDHHEYFRMLFIVANDDILSTIPSSHLERLRTKEAAVIDAIAKSVDRAKQAGLVRKDLDSHRQAVMAWGALTGVLTIQENGRRVDLGHATVDELYEQCLDMLLRGSATRRERQTPNPDG
jgi:AcrR family transcriptional regulator